MSHVSLRKTPLYDKHVALHARMAEFAGFLMPIYYRGILEEHQAVRRKVGVFDISHMGRLWVRGPQAFEFLQKMITHDLKKLKNGKILYTPLCNEEGKILDDILVYQNKMDEFYLVVNASNVEKDLKWLKTQAKGENVSFLDESQGTAFLAVQGPLADLLMEKLLGASLHDMGYYHFKKMKWKEVELLVSRTGYTGESGFEISIPKEKALDFWDELFRVDIGHEVIPVGLGARDTLRLEMRYLLYGHDMTQENTPLEAGLAWTISFHKGDFIGRQALIGQREEGLKRRLVGFEMIDQAIPRQGHSVLRDGREMGLVTSGSFSPTLSKNIGLAYIDIAYAHVGIPIYISIRGVERLAEIVKTPFYKGGLSSLKSKIQN
ncbi:MAG: glycine cleavage system aminomethyltransferase GcvT [Chlamydiae bacterium]|nr:glycine cleavage system aminomethyltransferase GcvT [Chlamydiota bacterium]MBI3267024.1 glycine cleavage system aminomethyltransferase GcvT [Chlamydiota bacterium]